jgi:PAS domain S-box-containing protein
MMQRDIVASLARLTVPAFAFDLSTLRFVAANPQFESLLGYSTKELELMTADSIRPEDDWPEFHQTLLSDAPQGFLQARYVRKDGTVVSAKQHYRHVSCVSGEGQPAMARLVVVEFWR